MEEKRSYYVWRSDNRTVGVVKASSAYYAAHFYALNGSVPYNIALRAVAVDDVSSFGIRLKEHGA